MTDTSTEAVHWHCGSIGYKYGHNCETNQLLRALAAERDALLPWAKLGVAVMEDWPDNFGDLDGFDLQEAAVKAGVLKEVPGGFDPEEHIDCYGGAEAGEPWFEIIRGPARAALTDGEEERG